MVAGEENKREKKRIIWFKVSRSAFMITEIHGQLNLKWLMQGGHCPPLIAEIGDIWWALPTLRSIFLQCQCYLCAITLDYSSEVHFLLCFDATVVFSRLYQFNLMLTPTSEP